MNARIALTAAMLCLAAPSAIVAQHKMTDTTGLVPLTEMGGRLYQGEDGGLYGGGSNTPPPAHLAAALREAAQIGPLDAQGRPSPAGAAVLISIGMSNTTQEFSEFKRLADADTRKSSRVTIVDGAQGARDASAWAQDAPASHAAGASPWTVLDRRLAEAGVTPQQVQAAWIKQARPGPASLGRFPEHARKLGDDLESIMRIAKRRCPNLRIAYLSSRIYAGYATTALNPEPYAYESAFAVRWLIKDQVRGDPQLNYSAERGPVLAPLALWGPYLWADGVTPRQGDGLVWRREDFGEDGTHPSSSGRRKVAEMLLRFFTSDATARPWFVGEAAGDERPRMP